MGERGGGGGEGGGWGVGGGGGGGGFWNRPDRGLTVKEKYQFVSPRTGVHDADRQSLQVLAALKQLILLVNHSN